MTTEDIFKTMQDLIAEQFAIDADEITMTVPLWTTWALILSIWWSL